MKIKHYKTLSSVACLGLMMLLTTPSFSASFQSHGSIKKTAEAYLMSKLNHSLLNSMEIKVTTGRLDPRLRLRQCEVALEPFLPTGAKLSGNTSVGIRCNGSKPWSLYVSAKIIKYADVYVTTRFLARGTRLKKEDFMLEKHNISNQSMGYVTEVQAVEGKILKRPLRHNSIIPPNALQNAMLVKKGDRVTIIAQNMGIKVHMKGKALRNGTEGDVIRVQNLSSKRVVEGRVLSAGVVGVQL